MSGGTGGGSSSAMNHRQGFTDGDLLVLDPQQLRTAGSGTAPTRTTPFHEAVVFVVGGGNYIEYQNLVDFAKVY